MRELYSVIGCVSVFSDYMKKVSTDMQHRLPYYVACSLESFLDTFMQLMQEDRSSFMILLDEFKDTLKDIQCWLQDASQSITKSKAKLLHSTMVLHYYSLIHACM